MTEAMVQCRRAKAHPPGHVDDGQLTEAVSGAQATLTKLSTHLMEVDRARADMNEADARDAAQWDNCTWKL